MTPMAVAQKLCAAFEVTQSMLIPRLQEPGWSLYMSGKKNMLGG